MVKIKMLIKRGERSIPLDLGSILRKINENVVRIRREEKRREKKKKEISENLDVRIRKQADPDISARRFPKLFLIKFVQGGDQNLKAVFVRVMQDGKLHLSDFFGYKGVFLEERERESFFLGLGRGRREGR